jgi:hypothetical protein
MHRNSILTPVPVNPIGPTQGARRQAMKQAEKASTRSERYRSIIAEAEELAGITWSALGLLPRGIPEARIPMQS